MACRSSVLAAVLFTGLLGCEGVPFTAREGTTITITANPTTIALNGGVSSLTATVIEDNGTPVANETVITWITTLGTITPESKTVDGIAHATLTSGGVGGDATVTAYSGPAKSNESKIAIGITASAIALSATPASLPGGGGTVAISAIVFGANGSPVPGATVAFSSTQGSLASAGRPQTTDSSGRATDTLTTTATADVTATSGSSTQKVTITVGTSGIEALILAADQVSLPGPGTVNLVATVIGTAGPIPGVAVAWSANAGSLAQAGTTITDASGEAANSLTTGATTIVTVAAGTRTATLTITVGTGSTVASVAVSANRSSIPPSSAPSGSCAVPAVLPVQLVAQVTDQSGNPVANIPTTFYVSFSDLSDCGRAFGEFCGGSTAVVANTNANGVASASYTMTQADFDFCNCLPSSCNCYSNAPGPPPVDCDGNAGNGNTGIAFCPDNNRCRTTATCRVTPTSEDLFCQVAIRAVAGGIESANAQFIEYGQ